MRSQYLLLSLLLLPSCLDLETPDTVLAHESDPIAACPIPAGPEDIPGAEADFYWCAEAAADDGLGCGPDGYLAGYGAVYAERFYRDTRPRMSARGRAWIDDVLICLQLELRAAIDSHTSCDDIRSIAFDSHPACYIDSGFCSLSVWDMLQVVWTVDADDWLSHDAARQVVQTALGCGRQYSLALAWFFGHLLD